MGIKTWRQKGRQGEYEVLDLLQPVVDKVFDEVGWKRIELTRNVNQSGRNRDSRRDGVGGGEVSGFDVAGLDWLALEIKRQENENLTQWWKQCKESALRRLTKEEKEMINKGYKDPTFVDVKIDYERVPVLIWRKNKERWKVRMFGYLLCDGGLAFDAGCGGRIRCPVDIGIEAFLLWFEMRLKWEVSVRSSRESNEIGALDRKSLPDPGPGAQIFNKSAPISDQKQAIRSQTGLFDQDQSVGDPEDPHG